MMSGMVMSIGMLGMIGLVMTRQTRTAPSPKSTPSPPSPPSPPGTVVDGSYQWKFRLDLNVEMSPGSNKVKNVAEKYTWKFVAAGSPTQWRVQSTNDPAVWLGYGKTHWLLTDATKAPVWTVGAHSNVAGLETPPGPNDITVRFSSGGFAKDKVLTIVKKA